jgi:GH35 family endo-1,4-beta-xylanase
MINRQNIGITLSHPQLEYLGIPLQEALEKTKDIFDFNELDKILNYFEQTNQKIVMTVGVKAPRWPEYFWPEHLQHKNIDHLETQKHILDYIEKTVAHLKTYQCITHWQVENEPLDPSGPENLSISADFLKQEVSLVRKLDSRPIIGTIWGNALVQRGLFPLLEKMVDIVGIDLYYKQYVTTILGKHIYTPPFQTENQLKNLINKSTKPVWITELQAEPWEKDEEGYKATQPHSITPDLMKQNIQKVEALPVKQIFLWGYEYWLWRAQQGDTRYLDVFK